MIRLLTWPLLLLAVILCAVAIVAVAYAKAWVAELDNEAEHAAGDTL